MGVIRLAFEMVFVTAAVIIIIGKLPTQTLFEQIPIEPVAYRPPDFEKVVAKMGWNDILGQKGRLLLRDKVLGAESLVVTKKFIYTGLADGRVIEIDKESINFRVVTRMGTGDGKQCYDFMYWDVDNCGRPLGMRMDSAGNLLVLDAHFGLFRVDVKTGEKHLLAMDPNENKDLRSLLMNDFVIDPVDQNIVYITVTSNRWPLQKIVYSIVEHENSGFVVAVDLKTRKATKIADKLFAANGIELSADNKYLLISESLGHRISKISLDLIRKQLKSGQPMAKVEVFADNLPGECDNIRLHKGDLYVAIPLARGNGNGLSDRLAEYPMIRKAVARIFYLSSVMLKFVRTSLYAHPALEEVEFILNSGHIAYYMVPTSTAVVILDGKTGQFKRLLASKKFAFISEAVLDEYTGDMFFGSFRNRFIGKLSAKDLAEN